MNDRKNKVLGLKVVAMNLAYGLGILAVVLLILCEPKSLAHFAGYVLMWAALMWLIAGIVIGAIHAGMKTASKTDTAEEN